MASEDRPRSLVDEQPEMLVHVPEVAEHPQAPLPVVEDRPTRWIDRREAPWVVVAAAVALIALLLLLRGTTTDVSAAPEGGGGTTAVDQDTAPWAALALPVPETLRTHTANVNGSLDVIAVANLAPGAANDLVGSVTTADGSMVQQILDDHALLISSPTGTTVVAFMPYPASDAPIVDPGQAVTFVGTLMPVPGDFAAMVGADAASIGALTGVYVRVVPETLRIVTPMPERS